MKTNKEFKKERVSVITAAEARKWLNRYNKEEDLYNTGIKEELRNKFQKERVMTKADLLKIVAWKFETMKGREQRIRNLLKDLADEDVKIISSAVFDLKEDELRFGLLTAIKGIGAALASTVLAFYDPDQYGIYDIHSWRGLMRTKEPEQASLNHVKKFWNVLRTESKRLGLSCRDLEKAYFKKDKEDPLVL